MFPEAESQDPAQVTIDLVTEHPETGVFALILVETWPWPPGTEDEELRRVQARLYGCVEAAVDGKVAGEYPNSSGRPFRIQLDTYDIPDHVVRPFFDRFADHVATWSELQESISTNRHVASLEFEYNHRITDGDGSEA